MTLQRKTLLIFSVSFLCLLATLYLASRFILQKNLYDSERSAAEHTLRASHGLLRQMVDQFDSRFADWAAWDDAADFVQTRNPEFIKSNLLDEALVTLHVHTMIFLDKGRRPVFSTGFDTEKKQKTPVPPAITQLLKDPAQTTFDKPDDSHSGLVMSNGRPLLVSLHPIVTTALKGPQRGTIIIGRYLDDKEMARLGEWGGAELTIRSVDDTSLSPELKAAKTDLQKRPLPLEALFVRSVDKEHLTAYKLLTNIQNKPSLLLQAIMPRDAYADSLLNLRYLVLALFASALVFGLVTVFALRRLVLVPLVDLGSEVRRVRDAGHVTARIKVGGEQELSQLAQSINGMLEALEQSHSSLHDSIAELERLSRELALVGELSGMMQSCRTREEAVEVIAQSLRGLFPTEIGALCIMNASQDRVEVVVSWGEDETNKIGTQPYFTPDECWALRRGRAHVVSDPRKQTRCAHALPEVETASLCMPLMAERQTLGVLYLRAHEAMLWTEEKLQLASTVSEQISLALFNLELQATLRNQSVRDPLTGLFNRRYMEESLSRELSRAERQKHQVAMIMFDGDHFKRFNDTFGHDAGDLVLKEIAQVLQSKSRKMDIACRYGGEEFLLILPNCPMDIAELRAEQLRTAVRELALTHDGQRLGQITLSLGVSCYPDHANTAETLVKVTDGLLYQAKKAGRDRVVSAGAVEVARVG